MIFSKIFFSKKSIPAVIGFLFATSSCAARAVELKFINDVNIPTSQVIEGTPFGGISGLTFDSHSQTFVGVSDDRSGLAPARNFIIDFKLKGETFEVGGANKITLTRKDGTEFPKGSIDGEGIAYHKSGVSFISSEGDGKVSPRLAPSIFVSNVQGRMLGEIELPAKFIPTAVGEQKQGVVNNGAFEGLALSPSGNYLFALLESPLAQDDSVADFNKGSINRGVVYKINDQGVALFEREFVYHVEAVVRRGANDGSGGNGVSEILALSDSELLVLERGGTISPEGVWTTQVKMYKVDLRESTDVQGFDSLRNRSYQPVSKTMILDFDSILSQLTPGFQTIDNLEAMVLGPKTKDGRDSLIIVSDNNFSDSQRNQFLFFAIEK